MTCPCYTIWHSNRASSRGEENLSALSSNVLKLRVQALNLPITGSKGQLLNRLKQALLGKVATSITAEPKQVIKAKARKGRPATRTTTVAGARQTAFQQTSTMLMKMTLSDGASLSSIEEMIKLDPEPDESSFQQNTGFSQSQRSAIEGIVNFLIWAFHHLIQLFLSAYKLVITVGRPRMAKNCRRTCRNSIVKQSTAISR